MKTKLKINQFPNKIFPKKPLFPDNFLPVVPAIIPELNHLEEFCDSKIFNTDTTTFALYLSSPRLCTFPKLEINTRIVVVGSSDVAIAFLESLIFTRHPKYQMLFKNITLVSTHGLTCQSLEDKIKDSFFVSRGTRTYKEMQKLSLRTYINIVNGVMTDIDRKNKKLVVNYTNCVSYDLLFLMCGEQFQKPKLKEAQYSKRKKKSGVALPKNVFLINSEVDAANAVTKLLDLIQQTEDEDCNGC